jgi:hypothetical protein
MAKMASSRSFGLLLCAMCAVVAARVAWRGGVPMVSGGLAAAFLVIAILVPRVLAPAKRLWLRSAALMKFVVGPVALTLMYALVVVPVGLLMRVFGRDSLSMKLASSTESYWVPREGGGPSAESLKEPY